MNLILVPFFLGQLNNTSPGSLEVRVAGNEITWKHGPEFTFNVTYITYLEPKSDSPAEKNTEQNWGTNLISQLKCRPIEQQRWHCHFNCTKFTKLTSQTYNKAIAGLLKNANYTSLNFGDASFEITTDGIENYKFNEKQETDDSLQKLYKLIVSNLYLSSRMNMAKGTKNVEKTSVGECPVTYTIETKKLDGEDLTAKKEFVITNSSDTLMKETIDIKKKVHLDECTSQQNYFTVNQQIHDFIPANSDIKAESSTGRLYVSPLNVASEIVNTFKVVGPNKTPVGTLNDHFRVRLESVDPVKKELRTLPNLSTLA